MRPCLRFLPILLLLAPFAAQAQTTGSCTGGSATTDLDIGGVRARLYNNGGLFWKGAGNVYNVPKTLNEPIAPNAVFAQGLWVGGKVNGELRQAAATYSNWEFYPGPPLEDGSGAYTCALHDRIWNVSTRDVRTYEQTSVASTDLREWPHYLGAPVIDGDGVPGNYNLAGGDRPEILGHQTAFWVMNDAGGPHLRTGSRPLGLEVRVQAIAFRSPSDALHYSTVYRYTFINRAPRPITETYIGMFSDPDLGNASDDYVGADSALDLAYVYNADNFDEGSDGYGTAPPALGYKVLDDPGLTTFLYYNGGSCNNCDPRGLTDDYYKLLQGRWQNGQRIYACGDGHAAQFASCGTTQIMFSGDPTAPAGQRFWSEFEPRQTNSAPNAPSDRRFAFSHGPFTLETDVPVTFTVAMVWARGANNLDSVTRMKAAAREVQAAYDATGFRGLPERPYPAVPQGLPHLVSPADGAADQPASLTVSWTPVSGAEGYELQVTGLDDPSVVQTYRLLETTARVPGGGTYNFNSSFLPTLDAGRYTWRVRGVSEGGVGAWSEAYTFTVGARPVLAVGYENFLVTHNAAGPLDPPEYGAIDVNNRGFPRVLGTTNGERGTPGRLQSTNNSVWGIHTADTDFSDGGFAYFVSRTTRDGFNLRSIGQHDYEWRFTGTSRAWAAFTDGRQYDVPFELWDVGTRADTSDDVRLVPYINPITGGQPYVFDIGADHPTSGGTNDPQTDWVYWMRPTDATPGDAGYRFAVSEMQRLGTSYNSEGVGAEVFARVVLVNFNGGTQLTGPFNATLPEPGTVFRIVTTKGDAPILSAPADGDFLATRQALLAWQEPAQGTTLRRYVEVATDPDFAQVVARDSSATAAQWRTPALTPGQRYYWRVRLLTSAITNAASGALSGWSATGSFTAGAAVGTESPTPLPEALTLRALYPNPAHGPVTVSYGLPEAGAVRIRVFDVLGREAARVEAGIEMAGWHRATVETSGLAPGLYVVRIEAGGAGATQALVVAR